MAKQMNFTADNGDTYAESYWIPVSATIDPLHKSGIVQFCGFARKAARTNGKAPIGRKEYGFGTVEYDLYFAPAAQNPQGKNPIAQCYDLAVATMEESTGLSFFNGALDV